MVSLCLCQLSDKIYKTCLHLFLLLITQVFLCQEMTRGDWWLLHQLWWLLNGGPSYNIKSMHGFSLVSPSGQVYDSQILCLTNVDSGDLVMNYFRWYFLSWMLINLITSSRNNIWDWHQIKQWLLEAWWDK